MATQRKFNEAAAEYQRVLKSAPGSIRTYFKLADYYRDRADSEHFEQAVEAAQEVTLSDHRLNYYLGVTLRSGNKDTDISEKDLRCRSKPLPIIPNSHPIFRRMSYLGKTLSKTWPARPGAVAV